MILRPLFRFKDTKSTGLLIFNSLKQKELVFNFVVNRNWKKLTDSRKRAKILADNRKSHHPIETLFQRHSIPSYFGVTLCENSEVQIAVFCIGNSMICSHI